MWPALLCDMNSLCRTPLDRILSWWVFLPIKNNISVLSLMVLELLNLRYMQ